MGCCPLVIARIERYVPRMRPTIRAGILAVTLSIAFAATACGDDDDAAATTDVPVTSLPAAATTTAPPAATTATPPTTTAATTTTDTDALASGSGCTPGPGALPDGEWFGFVADASAAELEFDLACWFIGDAAIAATAEDGEESPPPNDYYVRNTNPALRTVPVADDAQVSWLANVGSPALATIDYPTWLTQRVARGVEMQPGVWITITGGDVATIEEQYVP
jgi:hypothetical protein